VNGPRGNLPGGANQADDFGPHLADVLQATVNPRIWCVNGGTSVVHYYRPLRVLVISAPQETHEQLQDVIGQLRR